MRSHQQQTLAPKLLRGVVFLLVLAAVAALQIFLFLEVRLKAHDVDNLEVSFWGVLLGSSALSVWRKIFPNEEETERPSRTFVLALLSLLMLYAFRYFKNGSPFIDAEGLWESFGLLMLFSIISAFVLGWALPEKPKSKT